MSTVSKSKARKEALKEFGRMVLIGIVSSAIAAAAVFGGLIENPIIAAGFASFLTYIGKAWDKYVNKNEESSATGVVPF